MSDLLKSKAMICNRKGLHARASAALARMALKYDSRIRLQHEEAVADAASIMDLLMLTAHQGCVVEIEVEGSDAQEALIAITALIEDGFGEED